MNAAVLLLVSAAVLALGYRFYGRYLERVFKISRNRPTPAWRFRDGKDYLPSPAIIVFGHHFASIAGAGPIVGPVLAAYLGWGPVVLWILIGAVFIGGLHDFAALFLSVRHRGRSIGLVIEEHLGFFGRQIFLLFCLAALVLVVAIFALLVAGAFVTTPAAATASLLLIGLAPVFGVLLHYKYLRLGYATLIFVPLLFVAVHLGDCYPLDLMAMGLTPESARNIWLLAMLVYAAVASIMPVWVLLQPRDYLNSYLLYAMLAAGIAGIFIARPEINLPVFSGWSAELPGGGTRSLFPMLFVTVACGAVSGFHAIVASGTTSKQVRVESNMLPISYGAMLVEGLLAIVAVISVAIMPSAEYLQELRQVPPITAFANGLASLTVSIGLKAETGITFFALAISAFLLTTLDTATRLARLTWQEVLQPRREAAQSQPGILNSFFSNAWIATLIIIALAGFLSVSGNANRIWPVFGASNQLLAALTLLIVTLYLVRRKANFWIALVPMTLMMCVTIWALIELLKQNLGHDGSLPLLIATVFLLVMAGILAIQSAWSLQAGKRVSGSRSE